VKSKRGAACEFLDIIMTTHIPRAASAVSFFSNRSLSCADLYELDEQGMNPVEEALGDNVSTTDTSENGDPLGARAEDAGINESSSRNDLRRIHTMETFSWQGYSMQQQQQQYEKQQEEKNKSGDYPEQSHGNHGNHGNQGNQGNQGNHGNHGNHGNKGYLNHAQPSAAYPASYAQESTAQWRRDSNEMPAAQQQWALGEWPEESAWAGNASQHQGPGYAPAMAAQNSYMRPPQPAGYVVQNVPSKEGYQPAWYPANSPAAEDHSTQYRSQTPEAVPPQPNKQPNIVPVPVPVMLGPNGTMIPVPMGGPSGMPGVLPPQPMPPQAPQGIPALQQMGQPGQPMMFLRPNAAAPDGMQLFSFVGVPPQQNEAPKKQVKETHHTESTSNFGDDITLMLRNLPNKINQTKLLARLQSYRSKIDFLYLPTDFENKCNLGYAFINFVDGAAAARFKAEFNDKKLPGCRRSHKVLAVQPARVQGVSANVRRFRNSSVMGVLSEDEKPMLFKDGVQIPFPMPDGPLPPVGPRYPREGEAS